MFFVILLVFGALCLFVYLWFQKKMQTEPWIGKEPPIVDGSIPFVQAGLDWLSNPKEFLNTQRKKHGDIFLLKAFGLKLFFVFSNKGLIDFYQIPESHGSFTEATKGFLGYKVPEEILQGSMALIQKVLRRDFQKLWLSIFARTMKEEMARMGDKGSIDVFKWTKQIAHKAGFRSWIGEEAASPKYLGELISLFDQMDPEQGFTNMSSLLTTFITRRSKERKALYRFVDIVAEIFEGRKEPQDDFLEAMFEEVKELPRKQRNMRAACQIMAIHMASQSNLFAAISWTIVNLVQHGECRDKVIEEINDIKERFGKEWIVDQQALNSCDYLERCYYESIRIAQQSLTLRLVLKPVQIDGYTIPQGYYVATLLSCLNTDEKLLPKASEYLPEQHYQKGGKVNLGQEGSDNSVSTFGYGSHACPGRRFAIWSAIAIISSLFSEYNFKEIAGNIEIIPTQMGAVGRPINPAILEYERKK